MSKFTKHICVLLTIAIIAGCMVLSSFALDRSETISFGEETLNNYVLNEVGKYIGMSEEIIDENAEYSVSNAFPIEGNTDSMRRVFFTFKNEECIGQINADYINGSYYSSYSSQHIPEVSKAYLSNNSIALYSTDTSLVLISGLESHTIYGEETNLPIVAMSVNPIEISLTTVDSVEKPLSTARAASFKYINVPIKSNASVSGHGLCWMTCVASMMGHFDSSYNLETMDVYNDMCDTYGLPSVGYFDGNYIPRAFSMYNHSINWTTGGLTYSQVRSSMLTNTPIMATLSGTSFNNSNIQHAVVICGFDEYETGEYYYRLMDPNYDSYQFVRIFRTYDSDFTYPPSSGVSYSTWVARYW